MTSHQFQTIFPSFCDTNLVFYFENNFLLEIPNEQRLYLDDPFSKNPSRCFKKNFTGPQKSPEEIIDLFPSRCVALKTFYGDMSILPLASWNKFLDVFPSEERFQFIDKILVLFRTEHTYLQFINQHYQNNVFNDRFCQWTEQTEKICDEIKNAGHSLDGIVENLNSEINEITNQISWTAQQTQTQISNVEKALTNLLPNLVSVANSLEQCTGMLANHLDNNNSAK